MLTDYNALFILLLISTIFILFFGLLILGMKNKQQLHYAFLSTILTIAFWSLIRLIQYVVEHFYGRSYVIWEHLVYVGVCLLPVAVLLTGIIFAKTRIDFSWKYLLLFIVPLLSIAIVITNEYHHLFIVKYSFTSTEFEYGSYYIFHELYSYGCILIGMFYLLFFSVKNSGFFSKQSMLIFTGVLVPLVVVILSTQKLVEMPVFVENISFSFGIICFSIAIFKFQFLNIMPIALQKIVDLISDSYIVINPDLEILDYNLTFVNTFNGIFDIKRRDGLVDMLTQNKDVCISADKILSNNALAIQEKGSVGFEEHVTGQQFDKYFEVEITPIYSGINYLGSILLFKDVSEYKRNIEIIKRNQEILMEQERMASLGQMIGGIAHNLKTPIMSIAGGIEGLKDLVDEYDSSIDDAQVTAQDHHEIAKEMSVWLEKMKPYCSYMSDIISAVKGQAVQLNDSSTDKFTILELIKRIELLMKHELKKYHCSLITEFDIDMNTEIKGELNNLVQIFDNIIINAIQAYDGESGEISFIVSRKENTIEFSLRDHGRGIPQEVQKKLFKEMITTKGKNGTGLGLYMSYSTIKGRFGGNLWFTSAPGAGTTFYITIPCLINQPKQEA